MEFPSLSEGPEKLPPRPRWIRARICTGHLVGWVTARAVKRKAKPCARSLPHNGIMIMRDSVRHTHVITAHLIPDRPVASAAPTSGLLTSRRAVTIFTARGKRREKERRPFLVCIYKHAVASVHVSLDKSVHTCAVCKLQTPRATDFECTCNIDLADGIDRYFPLLHYR